MTRRTGLVALSLAFSLLVGLVPHASAFDDAARMAKLGPGDFQKVRSYLEDLIAKRKAPGITVAVVRKEGTIWAEGFGLADLEKGRKATPDTIYRLASVSKPITATGLMIQCERGAIGLDEPLNRYLPGAQLRAYVGSSEAMTVRRVANHTSGLPVHANFFYRGIAPTSPDETIRRYGFAAQRPGSRWEYSNLGYGLLGFITENVSHTPWHTYMEKTIYDPLGMTHTTDGIRPGCEADAAVQYTKDLAGQFIAVEPYIFDHPGASVICSSASDLGRFARMHLNGGALDGTRILAADSTRAMQKLTGKRPGGDGTGIGWLVSDDHGRRSVSHSGSMPGVATFLRLFPDDGLATVVLVNSDSSPLPSQVTDRLADVLFTQKQKEEKKPSTRTKPRENAQETFSEDWKGTWTGRLVHFDGPIDVRLDVESESKARVTLGKAPAADVEEFRIRGNSLTGSVVGKLHEQPSNPGLVRLELKLDRHGDKLTGVGMATAAEVFALSHWLELEKDEAKLADAAAGAPYDLLIRHARIVDGCGTPWYRGDVAVAGGRIAKLGRVGDIKAKRTIDAAGLVVAPGFIDMMGQTASPFLESPRAGDNLLRQGITTINAGEGESAAPLSEADGKKAGWRAMREYFAKLEARGMPMNLVQTVGHTQVRQVVLGDVDRQPSAQELEQMQALVREAMDAGAVGLSTSLIYPPAVYARTEEIVALARVVGEHGGGYFTHMRNEGDRLLEAIDEALAIGRQAHTPVHIFHLKAAGQGNWPKLPQAIAKIQAARAEGQQVAADIYPYLNNGLGLASFIHPRHAAKGHEELLRLLDDRDARNQIAAEMKSDRSFENWFLHVGSDWDRVMLGGLTNEPYKAHNGESLGRIAKALNKDEWDVFFEAAKQGAFAMPQSMSEANVILAMKQEFVSFDTDVGPAGTGVSISTHPRAAGSFPRILGRYVRSLGALSLEQAIARMTSVAANELMLRDRGRLAPGLAADLVLFDPSKVDDRSTFAEPLAPPAGIRFVIVNGQVVIDESQPTAALPGQILRGPGYRPTRE